MWWVGKKKKTKMKEEEGRLKSERGRQIKRKKRGEREG